MATLRKIIDLETGFCSLQFGQITISSTNAFSCNLFALKIDTFLELGIAQFYKPINLLDANV